MDLTQLRCMGSLFFMLHQTCRNVALYKNNHHLDSPMPNNQLERCMQQVRHAQECTIFLRFSPSLSPLISLTFSLRHARTHSHTFSHIPYFLLKHFPCKCTHSVSFSLFLPLTLSPSSLSCSFSIRSSSHHADLSSSQLQRYLIYAVLWSSFVDGCLKRANLRSTSATSPLCHSPQRTTCQSSTTR